MGFSYGFKLFGGGGAGGSGVGTSLTTQVLFNSSGSVAGDAGLTYDAATDTLSVGLVHSQGVRASGFVGMETAPLGVGEYRAALLPGRISVSSDSTYDFSSTTNATAGADSGLRRVSPGLVGVTDGSTGKGNLNLGIPAYADNAAALAGGLVAGTLYYTDVAGEYVVKVAH